LRSLKWLLIISAMLLVASLSGAAELSVDAQVDRAEVGFGESFNLIVIITQNLSSGRSHRLSVPTINSIPGFDIASTRSGQSTSFINGVGVSRSQVVYELVPQQPGKATIPAFSFSDPDGNQYTSKPIEINILTPEETPAETPGQPEAPRTISNKAGGYFFKIVLIAGLVFGLIVAIPFFLYAFSGNGNQAADYSAAAAGLKPPGKSEPQTVEDAEIITLPAVSREIYVRVDFGAEVARLKSECPEAGIEFYRRYFEIFRAALIGNSSIASSDLTVDELFVKVCGQFPRNDIALACQRLAGDLELVMYANRPPTRQFSGIDSDAREILTVISD